MSVVRAPPLSPCPPGKPRAAGVTAALGASAALLAGAVAGMVGCGGDDVPIGGARGGAMAALLGPTQGNMTSHASGGDDASAGYDSSTAGGDGGGGSAGPTWSGIYAAYFGICKTCHTQMSSARAGYVWLRSQGYITGTTPALVDPTQSCLAWYGGNMPPGNGPNAQAVSDMNAWAATGAQDD